MAVPQSRGYRQQREQIPATPEPAALVGGATWDYDLPSGRRDWCGDGQSVVPV